jgi:hypothetical protein
MRQQSPGELEPRTVLEIAAIRDSKRESFHFQSA